MRTCGVLLPVASLPSKYGIGTFSKEAYEFIDQLWEAGQNYWQILPLGPTGYGDSPYQSFSAFAGNPYFRMFGIFFQVVSGNSFAFFVKQLFFLSVCVIIFHYQLLCVTVCKADIRNPLRYLLMNAVASRSVSGS